MGLEYAVPEIPEGSVAVIVRAEEPPAATTSERATDLVCTGFSASVTVTVKLEVPEAVGVPERRPVPGVSVIPAGRLPALTDQV
jgi:hypothetical protein